MLLHRRDDDVPDNETILQNHYEYLRELHAGNDQEYLAEKECRRKQYIDALKNIG